MKTQFRYLSTLALMTLALIVPKTAWAGGTEPSTDSNGIYQIASKENLIWFRDAVNGINKKTTTIIGTIGQTTYSTSISAKLTDDITDLGDWESIGTKDRQFAGTFDGNGKTISGMSATNGFFRYTNGATIQNFTLAGTLSALVNDVGSVVGNASGATKIYNVCSSVNITVPSAYALNHIGGIVGQASQADGKTVQIKGCTYKGTMSLGSCSDSNGGIVGYCEKNANVEIEYCAFLGSITTSATSPRIGGILGYADDDGDTQNFKYIKYCYCDGTLSPKTGTDVGVFAGCPKGKVPAVITYNRYVSNGTTNMAGNGYHSTLAGTGKYNYQTSVTVQAGSNGSAKWEYVCPKYDTTNGSSFVKVKATATPASHYHFTKWTSTSSSSTSISTSTTYTADAFSGVLLYANFAIDMHTISVTAKNGTVSATVGGQAVNLSQSLPYGTELTLTATPKEGYHFVNWDNDESNTNKSRTVTVKGNYSYTANFQAHSFTVASNIKVEDVTCTEPAKYKYKCSCGVIEDDASHLAPVGDALGHDYQYFKCSRCGYEPDTFGNVTMSDATPYARENGFIVGEFKYSRTLESTNWTTWYVPFELELTDWVCERYAFSRINNVHQYDDDGDGKADRTVIESFRLAEGARLEADYPYLVKALSDEYLDMDITVLNATFKEAREDSIICQSVDNRYTFKGTFSQMGDSGNSATSPYTLFYDGNWYHYHSLAPQRHYLTITPRSSANQGSAAKISTIQLQIAGEESATGIVRLYSEEQKQRETYDLSGRRIDATTTHLGIRIVNGRKELVK